ncbi:uncharacterized protein [Haliotis asinina]|uniref:uncharacterized protein n=1 Tax=Haliotis asinina TaxID=109174 RepID=UPI00353274AA
MGPSQRQIARTFNCSQTTIRKLLIRYQQTGKTKDRQRSGRLRVTTAAKDRYIRQIHLRNRSVTATSLGHVISQQQHFDDFVQLVYELTTPSMEWRDPFTPSRQSTMGTFSTSVAAT